MKWMKIIVVIGVMAVFLITPSVVVSYETRAKELEQELVVRGEEVLRYKRIIAAMNAEMYKMEHPEMTTEETEVYQRWSDEYDEATQEYFDYLEEHPETEPQVMTSSN